MIKNNNDKNFSSQLLELSGLREIIIQNSSYSDDIVASHGSIVKLSNGDQLYDLRSYFFKPLWGHSHPYILKNLNSIEKCLKDRSDETSLKKDTKYFASSTEIFPNTSEYVDIFLNNKHYIISKKFFKESKVLTPILKYMETVLITGGQLNKIQKTLESFFSAIPHIQQGNSLYFEIANSDFKNVFYKNGLLVNDHNIINSTFCAYIPVTLTQNQLNQICQKLNLSLKEILCLS